VQSETAAALRRVIFLGAPGAGKGTQAQVLMGELGIPQISTGDILRAAVREGTPLGKKAQTYMDQGALVPDALVIGLIEGRLKQPDAEHGWILDGFPRTDIQAEALDALLDALEQPLGAAVLIDVPEERLVERLTGRRVCPLCKRNFHILFNPPPGEAPYCQDHLGCPSEVIQRPDDAPEVVLRRLQVYRAQTEPLIAYYRDRQKLHTVNGDLPPAKVTAQLLALFG
jgi:adenylate kinase